MIYSHFKEIEGLLIAFSQIQNSSGHTLHKGNPREFFIKNFLEDHLPKNVSIGTGEIINSNSLPSEKRNQFDIIIQKNNFPKINFGGDTNCYLIESVAATIEVKSTITKKELKKAIIAAKNVKSLNYSYKNSDHKKIRNFLIAYKSSVKKIETIYEWLKEIHKEEEIVLIRDGGTKVLNRSSKGRATDTVAWRSERPSENSPTLNGIFILNQGSILLNNGMFKGDEKKTLPVEHIMIDEKDKNVILFFLLLLEACANEQNFDIYSYMKGIRFSTKIESDNCS